jgi:hypothetical protein
MVKILPARSFSLTEQDPLPDVKVILKGGEIIFGQLQLVTEDSIYILPGTKKDAKKGRSYKQIGLSYKEIVAIRFKEPISILMLLFGLLGLTVLFGVIIGEIPLFNNGFGESIIYVFLSPLVVGASIFQLLKRKRYGINGKKSRFKDFRDIHKEKRNLIYNRRFVFKFY